MFVVPVEPYGDERSVWTQAHLKCGDSDVEWPKRHICTDLRLNQRAGPILLQERDTAPRECPRLLVEQQGALLLPVVHMVQ